MKRVLFIFGTRPEAIKLAPVIRAMQARPGEFVPRVCVTAQHREMLDEVLRVFGLRPDEDLNVMRPGQRLAQLTARILEGVDGVLERETPDWVVVQGDTTSVMAAALAAHYRRVKIGHVEAGLRSGDKFQPFPEEINRRVASVVADLHFAPTSGARDNLLREGIAPRDVVVTGNTVIDALQWVVQQPETDGAALQAIPEGRRIVLVTAHRRENFGEPLRNICGALDQLSRRFERDVQIVYPVHLNPNVQGPVRELLGARENITLLPPLDYVAMARLLRRSCLVLTDSGGLQEEAPGLGKPVLVLRNTTERPEAVESGSARLVGTDTDVIVNAAAELLENEDARQLMARARNPFGDGRASERICDCLAGTASAPWPSSERAVSTPV